MEREEAEEIEDEEYVLVSRMCMSTHACVVRFGIYFFGLVIGSLYTLSWDGNITGLVERMVGWNRGGGSQVR